MGSGRKSTVFPGVRYSGAIPGVADTNVVHDSDTEPHTSLPNTDSSTNRNQEHLGQIEHLPLQRGPVGNTIGVDLRIPMVILIPWKSP